MVRGWYADPRGQVPAPRLRAYLEENDLRRLLRPLFGDPDAGTWPHDDPFAISDEDALAALLLPTDLDGEERYPRFARVMYAVRIRRLWVPAADALARLALREPTEGCPNRSREYLALEWRTLFPKGPPREWPAGGFGAYKVKGRSKASHGYRHILRFAANWLALVGDPALLGGATARSLVDRPLPKVAADASAVWLCLQVLLAAKSTCAAVEDLVPGLLSQTPPDLHAEEVLRQIGAASASASTRTGVRPGASRSRTERFAVSSPTGSTRP